MAAQPTPQPDQQSQGQDQQGGDPLQDFRQLAQQVQQLGQKYKEAAEPAAQILKLIQQMMVQVSSSQQRQPQAQAPPMS